MDSVAGNDTEKEMRKFRAKTYDGEWVYGYPHPTPLGNWLMRDDNGTGVFINPDTIEEPIDDENSV